MKNLSVLVVSFKVTCAHTNAEIIIVVRDMSAKIQARRVSWHVKRGSFVKKLIILIDLGTENCARAMC